MALNSMTPLVDAKKWLRDRLHAGAQCPCCGQWAKVYKRKINAGMAKSLIRMYRTAGTGWVHVPTMIGSKSREEGKLAYWGLVEEQTGGRPDGGRAGFWRVTDAGERFVCRQKKVPKYANVYNGKVLGFDATEMVDIRDALGSRFDYAELMSQ